MPALRRENAWHSGVVGKQRALKSYAITYSYPSLTHITLHVPSSDMCHHHHGHPHMLTLTSHCQQRLLHLSLKNCECTLTRIGKPKSNPLTPYHSYMGRYLVHVLVCYWLFCFTFISHFKIDSFSIAPLEIRHISLSAASFQAIFNKRFNFSAKIWVFRKNWVFPQNFSIWIV